MWFIIQTSARCHATQSLNRLISWASLVWWRGGGGECKALWKVEKSLRPRSKCCLWWSSMDAVLLEQKGFFSDDCVKKKKEKIYIRKKTDFLPPSAEATLITSQKWEKNKKKTRQVPSSTLETSSLTRSSCSLNHLHTRIVRLRSTLWYGEPFQLQVKYALFFFFLFRFTNAPPSYTFFFFPERIPVVCCLCLLVYCPV